MGADVTTDTETLSPALHALECIRCGARYPVADHPRGCPACDTAGRNSNLFCVYDERATLAERLPYRRVPGFGHLPTPLIPWSKRVHVKNEAAQHTGSHKDRFAAVAAAHARAAGYRALAVGSSGNAALALAAYAAAAGLECAVASFSWLPEATRLQLTTLGARLDLFDNDTERRECVLRLVDDPHTLTVSSITEPAVGSHCLGIEGYKQIAWEIGEQMAEDVDHVVLPSSRGDLAWGVYLGFRELESLRGRRMPRLHLVEPIPRLSAVLEAGAPVTAHFPGDFGRLSSIAGHSTTVQAHQAVTRSAGTATVVPDSAADRYYTKLCRAGHVWERSSTTVFAAHDLLVADGTVREGDTTVLVATSHLFKGL